MTIFLQNKGTLVDTDIKSIAGRLLSVPVISSQRIGGGFNSRVYQIGTQDASKYILKFYQHANEDKRDRLNTEFSSLTFLWKNGVRSIPEPIAVAEDEKCAIYQFIEGEKIFSKEIQSRDIECAVAFLAELKSLRNNNGISSCASEAFFSAKEINENIQTRVNRLKKNTETGAEYDALKDYLNNDFLPFGEILIQWAKKKFSELDMSFAGCINEKERTLSPSDFGFHNALKDKTGRIVFLDFEHFGWDDPVKTISDFLLHPAMTLSRDIKQQFVTGVLKLFKECAQLKYRLKILYPFFGLKWCLIFLNEFIPEDLRRRHFAQTINKPNVHRQQLSKAQNMLNAMKQTYREFPYNIS